VIAKKLIFISFEMINGEFRGLFSMKDALSIDKEPRALLRRAAKKYAKAIGRMVSILDVIKSLRKKHEHVTARKMWQIGNIVFLLLDDLKSLGLQIDGIYDHLERDLVVKRKWLEKAVIFRRYIPNIGLIPKSLNWGKCEKGTRRVAERIKIGLFPS